MAGRYAAFQFVLSLNGRAVGGFSDVSGLEVSGPRAGVKHLTLKRGILQSSALNEWVGAETATLSLFDESRRAIQTWSVRGALPEKHTGPLLAGRGGGDVTMEELVLSVESVEPV